MKPINEIQTPKSRGFVNPEYDLRAAMFVALKNDCPIKSKVVKQFFGYGVAVYSFIVFTSLRKYSTEIVTVTRKEENKTVVHCFPVIPVELHNNLAFLQAVNDFRESLQINHKTDAGRGER